MKSANSNDQTLSPFYNQPSFLTEHTDNQQNYIFTKQIPKNEIMIINCQQKTPLDFNKKRKIKKSKTKWHTKHKKKGNWTKREDKLLTKLVQQYGACNWTQIATSFKRRIGKQCRERWHNHLDPFILKKKWTHEEQLLLIAGHKKFGNKWSQISKLLPGRTDNCIKNHWNSTIQRLLKLEKIDFSQIKIYEEKVLQFYDEIQNTSQEISNQSFKKDEIFFNSSMDISINQKMSNQQMSLNDSFLADQKKKNFLYNIDNQKFIDFDKKFDLNFYEEFYKQKKLKIFFTIIHPQIRDQQNTTTIYDKLKKILNFEQTIISENQKFNQQFIIHFFILFLLKNYPNQIMEEKGNLIIKPHKLEIFKKQNMEIFHSLNPYLVLQIDENIECKQQTHIYKKSGTNIEFFDSYSFKIKNDAMFLKIELWLDNKTKNKLLDQCSVKLQRVIKDGYLYLEKKSFYNKLGSIEIELEFYPDVTDESENDSFEHDIHSNSNYIENFNYLEHSIDDKKFQQQVKIIKSKQNQNFSLKTLPSNQIQEKIHSNRQFDSQYHQKFQQQENDTSLIKEVKTNNTMNSNSVNNINYFDMIYGQNVENCTSLQDIIPRDSFFDHSYQSYDQTDSFFENRYQQQSYNNRRKSKVTFDLKNNQFYYYEVKLR